MQQLQKDTATSLIVKLFLTHVRTQPTCYKPASSPSHFLSIMLKVKDRPLHFVLYKVKFTGILPPILSVKIKVPTHLPGEPDRQSLSHPDILDQKRVAQL